MQWVEEFEDGEFDTSLWRDHYGCNGTDSDQCRKSRLHSEGENFLFVPENVVVNEDGHLELWIRPGPVSHTYTDPVTNITSTVTRPNSAGTLQMKRFPNPFHRGRFEIRAKIAGDRFSYSTFWLWGINHVSGISHEIDIYEISAKPNVTPAINTNVHRWTPPHIWEQLKYIPDDNITDDWHIYALEWDEHFLYWYYDGNLIRTMSRLNFPDFDPSTGGEVSCDQDAGHYEPYELFPPTGFHMGLVIDNYLWDVNQEAPISQEEVYLVDWVKFYSRQVCDGVYNDITLPAGDHWWVHDADYANVILEDGATLRIIDCEISMAEGSTFLCRPGSKLILDDGAEFSWCGKQKWEGIVCQDCTIETSTDDIGSLRVTHAKTGIRVSDVAGDPREPRVKLKRTTVRNCDTGMLFEKGSYTAELRQNSLLSSCDIGVVSEGLDGLVIDRTTFEDCRLGLHAMGASVFVRDGNMFQNYNSELLTTRGIIGTYSYPFESDPLTIGSTSNSFSRNLIQNVDLGIGIAGAAMTQDLYIINTEFRDLKAATTIHGSNDFLLGNNEFINDQLGVTTRLGNLSDDRIQCNLLSDNLHSVVVGKGPFPNTLILGNDFESTPTDSYKATREQYIRVEGEVANPMSQGSKSAGNCFSDRETQSIKVGATAPAFEYRYTESNTCEELFMPENILLYETSEESDVCRDGRGIYINKIQGPGSGTEGAADDVISTDSIVGDPDIYGDTLYVDACRPCILDSIARLRELLVQIGGDDPVTCEDETDDNPPAILVRQVTNRLNDWIYYGMQVAIKTQNESFGDSILANACSWYWQKRYIGFKIRLKNYTRAKNLLDAIEPWSGSDGPSDKASFKDIRYINLKYLQDSIITVPEVDFLFDEIHAEVPSSAFALGLYHRITNRPYWPPIDLPLSSNSIGTDNTSNDHHLVYPNPSSDQVNINGLTRGSSLIVVDALGRVVYTTRDMKTNNLTISIADWQDGIYYLRESCINGHVKTSVLCKI